MVATAQRKSRAKKQAYTEPLDLEEMGASEESWDEDIPYDQTITADDAIRRYLKEIGRVPLLSHEQETKLALRVAAGDTEATQQLAEANLRLVVSIAKRYSWSGVPLLDLIQEGNLGLLRAIEKFDANKGHRLSTYATWWIRQAIGRFIAEQGRIIRIPVHMVELIYRIKRIARQRTQEFGREATAEEVGLVVGLSKERVIELLQVAELTLSLDAPIADEDDYSLGDILEDTQALAPAAAVTQQGLRDQLENALAQLTIRERQVIEMRFGFLDGHCRTLEEVSEEFHLTRERIRQIEAKALRQLRSPMRSHVLREYME